VTAWGPILLPTSTRPISKLPYVHSLDRRRQWDVFRINPMGPGAGSVELQFWLATNARSGLAVGDAADAASCLMQPPTLTFVLYEPSKLAGRAGPPLFRKT
jgi:hypothetical protein